MCDVAEKERFLSSLGALQWRWVREALVAPSPPPPPLPLDVWTIVLRWLECARDRVSLAQALLLGVPRIASARCVTRAPLVALLAVEGAASQLCAAVQQIVDHLIYSMMGTGASLAVVLADWSPFASRHVSSLCTVAVSPVAPHVRVCLNTDGVYVAATRAVRDRRGAVLLAAHGAGAGRPRHAVWVRVDGCRIQLRNRPCVSLCVGLQCRGWECLGWVGGERFCEHARATHTERREAGASAKYESASDIASISHAPHLNTIYGARSAAVAAVRVRLAGMHSTRGGGCGQGRMCVRTLRWLRASGPGKAGAIPCVRATVGLARAERLCLAVEGEVAQCPADAPVVESITRCDVVDRVVHAFSGIRIEAAIDEEIDREAIAKRERAAIANGLKKYFDFTTTTTPHAPTHPISTRSPV